MTAAVANGRWDPAFGWIGSLSLHAAIAVLSIASWAFLTPPKPPVQMLAIEATVVTASATRQTPTVPPPPAHVAPPAPSPEPVPAPEIAKTPRPAASELLTTPVPKPAERAPPNKPVVPAPSDAERKARDATEAREREAALRASMAREERSNALRSSAAAASWYDALRAHIERQWRKPVTARAGLRCTVLVDQIPGGEVTSVRIADCNGDEAVRQSIEAAVLRASPLPPPPDAALFERRLELVFAPSD